MAAANRGGGGLGINQQAKHHCWELVLLSPMGEEGWCFAKSAAAGWPPVGGAVAVACTQQKVGLDDLQRTLQNPTTVSFIAGLLG